jgi:hypothetical protein
LQANTAINCQGSSSSGTGVYVVYLAQNCVGISSSYIGVDAQRVAQNCYGESSTRNGLDAEVAIGCAGFTGGPSYYGLYVVIGVACTGENLNVTYKYNMP